MARRKFTTRISHVRLVVGAFSSDQMATLAQIVADSVRVRIQSGLNVNDEPSKALSPKYAERKQKKGKNPIRDWTMSGQTLRCMAVLTANENRATVGFTNPIANRIAHWNNMRERAFGISPRDRQALVNAVHSMVRDMQLVKLEQTA